jgi:SP family general alpha glucoside:H+ symporter-like MFS transporter
LHTVLGSITGLPVFREKYGVPAGNGDFQLDPQWQSAIGQAPTIGNILLVRA